MSRASWGVAGDMVVIEWGEKSCETEFEMNLENNFKLLSHHYSLHWLPSVPPPQNDNNKQHQHQDDGWWTTNGEWQKGAQETSMSTSLGPQVSFFYFFLFLILLTTILNRLHVLQVTNDGQWMASGKKGKRCRFRCLLGQVSFFRCHFILFTML